MPLSGSQFLAVAQEAPGTTPRPYGLRALLARQAPRSSTGLLARFASGYLLGGIPEPDPVLYSQRSGAMPSAYALTDLITTSRASKASYFDGLGQIREANNNVALLTFDPLTLKSMGLLSQKAATNTCNTRCEGARVGTFAVDGASSTVGALPTGMSAPSNGGLTMEVTRIIPMGDANAVEIRARGIANGDIRMYLASGVAAAEQGDWYSTSGMIMAAAGVQPACSWAIRSLTAFPSNLLGLTRSWQRVRSTRQLNEASPGEARIELRFYLAVGQAYDWTFRFYIPALEKAALCSYAPMLPPVGSPTAPVTRAADLYTITDLARIAFNGLAGTFVFRFWLDSLPLATSTAEQLGLFLTYSSTTSFMRLTGRFNAAVRVEAGSDGTVTLDSGGLVIGENTLAYSFSQERMSLSVNGNDTVSAAWGSVMPPSAADGLRLGDMSTASSRKLNGPIGLFTYAPVETTGADLKAASAAALTM
ncbi:hypothetical protein BKE38_12640 [Pseudoroseomonas deserti]|uniref:Uncharacterized protein n=1 Tax=Teichococcus deserti TaxID=1817963 RepID=A0A1V2H2F5_9PROT|nr:hypothetical protein [Pseudoroseomonas deserti]ONG53302.1 hypothetical protein BKE38_12640 [Pseudoroseomonas deserti]